MYSSTFEKCYVIVAAVRIKSANTSNRGRAWLFSKNETMILVLKNVQFKFSKSVTSLLLAARTCAVANAAEKVFTVKFTIIVFKIESSSFSVV